MSLAAAITLPHLQTPTPAKSSLSLWQLRVDQYHRMITAGVLTEDDPVELLSGLLVTKMPKNPAHRLSTQLIRDWIAHCLPSGWFVDSQEPLTTEDSEPEPDVMIVRGERRDYSQRHPYPADVAVVIEVAETSVQRDRGIKLALYARARLPEYWIVNLPERQIEIYRKPDGQAVYAECQVFKNEDAVTLSLTGTVVATQKVSALLP